MSLPIPAASLGFWDGIGWNVMWLEAGNAFGVPCEFGFAKLGERL
jgi:hypothetical protein